MAIFVNTTLSEFKRIPTRPRELQGDKFTEKFDFDTLFYDCFRENDTHIMIIAPALFNLRNLMDNSAFYHNGLAVPYKIKQFKRVTRIRIKADKSVKSLNLKGAIGEYTLPVRENELNSFKDLRVLTTMQKDNNLIWIEDWVKFYRDVHGAEAVLIYDNASTAYSIEELEARLLAIKGLKAVKIISWPYKYGPGAPLSHLTNTKYWDSNFSKTSALEHARRCFLAEAKSVNFTDVDELVVSPNEKSVFEETEKSVFGVNMTPGRWIVATKPPNNNPRHSDYTVMLKKKPYLKRGFYPADANACKTKWTIVPRKIPDFALLDVHQITGWLPSRLVNNAFTFRHFRDINLNWFDNRVKIDQFSHETHEIDHDLMRDFAKITKVTN